MYIQGYNPALHDMYLYGEGNTGFPIALNPNCIIYDAKESYKYINALYRDWNSPRPGTIPPGLSAGAKPNYYNADLIRSQWIGPNFLMTATHMFVNEVPLLCFSGGVGYAGLGAFETSELSGINSELFTFWEGEFFGFTTPSAIGYAYELTENPIGIGTPVSLNNSNCPNGLPDVSYGTTFYRFTNRWDAGIIKVYDDVENGFWPGPYMRTVSIFSLLTNEQKQTLSDFTRRLTNSLYINNNYSTPILKIPVDNLYIIGGNQTVAPVDGIEFICASFYGGTDLSGFGINYFGGSYGTPQLWGGDSSGLLVYKKNNELFGIGVYTGGGLLPGLFSALNTERYPSMEYLLNYTDIPVSFYYSNTEELKLATNSQFTKLTNKLNSTLQNLQNTYNNLTG